MKKNLPQHIGLILDGNRTWARAHGKTMREGYLAGIARTKQAIDYFDKRGIRVTTLYAFSTENWKRSEENIKLLFKLFKNFLGKNIRSFIGQKSKLKVIGDISKFPADLRNILKNAVKRTERNSRRIVQVALNYGGRDEIVRAINKILHSGKKLISEKTFEKYLDTNGVSDPDLIIRTSGNQRLSNFLTWQSVYSELFFTPKYLPELDKKTLDEALEWYISRKRTKGGD